MNATNRMYIHIWIVLNFIELYYVFRLKFYIAVDLSLSWIGLLCLLDVLFKYFGVFSHHFIAILDFGVQSSGTMWSRDALLLLRSINLQVKSSQWCSTDVDWSQPLYARIMNHDNQIIYIYSHLNFISYRTQICFRLRSIQQCNHI